MTTPEIEARERRKLPTRKRHRRRKGLDFEDDDPEPIIGPGEEPAR